MHICTGGTEPSAQETKDAWGLFDLDGTRRGIGWYLSMDMVIWISAGTYENIYKEQNARRTKKSNMRNHISFDTVGHHFAVASCLIRFFE